MFQANAPRFLQEIALVLASAKRTTPSHHHFALFGEGAINFLEEQDLRCAMKCSFGIADRFGPMREVVAHLRTFPGNQW